MTSQRRRCEHCGHTFHRDQCPRKASSGCLPLLDDTGQQTGIACYRDNRPPCPCPQGECHDCGAPIVGATPYQLGYGIPEVDIDTEPATVLDGEWAVRNLPDGTLACRALTPGEQPGDGEWLGQEHRCAT